jgi:hypothetical protein
MARHKKHKKTHHRRRMGAAGKRGLLGGLMEGLEIIGGMAGGVLLGRFVNNMINSPTATTPTISPTMLGGGEAAVSAVVINKVKRSGLKAVVAGFGGNGLIYALGNSGMKLLPTAIGYGPDPMHRPMNIGGFREVPKIGFPQPGAIGRTGQTGDRERARMVRTYAGIYG